MLILDTSNLGSQVGEASRSTSLKPYSAGSGRIERCAQELVAWLTIEVRKIKVFEWQ